MAMKLLPLRCSKKFPNWVYLRLCNYSVSSAVIPVTSLNILSTSSFDEKIRFLKNRLRPDSLVQVLDSTHDLDSSLKLFKWTSLQSRFRHSADTYYKLILKLGMNGNVEKVEGFCREMVRERLPGTEDALVALIDSFVENGRLDEALKVCLALCLANFKPSIGVYNGLLSALVEEKRNFSDFMLVYKEMVKSGIVPTTDTLNYLLEALFDSDRVGVALDQYRRMKKKRCDPNSRTFELVISRLIERDQIDESLVVLDEMFALKFEPGSSFYVSIIPLICRINKLESGLKLFYTMKGSKLSADIRVFEALIKSLCGNQLVDEAIDLVKETVHCGLTPSDDVLLDVINSLCRLGMFDEATNFLEEKQIWGSVPRNSLLRGYCKVGKFYEAEILISDMLERGLADAMSWNILIRWLSENTSLDKTFKFLGRMIVTSYVPDYATYSALVVGNCRISNYEDAIKLFHRICSMSWVLDSGSYAELVECLCQNNMTQDAGKVFLYMSNKRVPLQLSSFNMLIKLFADENIYKAIRILYSAYYSGTCSSTETYNIILIRLLKAENVDNLLVLLSRMVVEGITLDGETYAILLESMILFGHTKDYCFLFDLMFREGLLPQSETLNNLLLCFGKYSLLHTVLLSIERLVQNEKTLNSKILNTLIKGLWEEGYKTVACRLLDVMLEKGWVPDAIVHGLLMGSVSRERDESKLEKNKDTTNSQDNVSNILTEGLVMSYFDRNM